MIEVNFDGLVSPSHNYAGLAVGNLASARSEGTVSRPRVAALQGLEKMLVLSRRGIPQAFLPPHLRPSLPALRRLGFHGDDADILRSAFHEAPDWFAACSSASSMWAANAATVAPSRDTADHKVHFTPANLVTHFHRAIETAETAALFRSIFSSDAHFVHHLPLPATPALADEGAANHTRLSTGVDGPGLHVFVYGADPDRSRTNPHRFPARQTLEASQAVARLHRLPANRTLFVRQNPDAIDAGVFHNDVIATGHHNVFLCHERAFSRQNEAIAEIRSRLDGDFCFIPVPDAAVPLRQAVESYLFNSQIVSLPGGGMLLLCPTECRDSPGVNRFIRDRILAGDNPIREVHFQDLRQSMQNGGGPACLRLRVLLTPAELETLPTRLFFTPETHAFLHDWITRHYPDALTLRDLADPARHRANARAIAELYGWIQGRS